MVTEATAIAQGPAWPWRRLFLSALGVTLFADLLSKWWVFRSAELEHPLWLPLLQRQWQESSWVVPQINPGAAWSIGADHPWLIFLLTVVLVPLICGYYWFAMRHSQRWIEHLGFALIIGGALGNAWDRLTAAIPGMGYGGVRDFIHCDLNLVGIPYIWPTFNLADSGITIGLGMVILGALTSSSKACQGPPKCDNQPLSDAQGR